MHRFIELLRALRDGELTGGDIDARMAPLISDPGFDRRVAVDFLSQQEVSGWLSSEDRERILGLLAEDVVQAERTVLGSAAVAPEAAGSAGGEPADSTVIAGAGGGGQRSSVAVGDTVKDRFVLESHIGSGGMGDVFRALDLRKEEAQDRDPYVAIKILNQEFRSRPEALMTLQREARRAQALAHPNIVRVYDFDRDDDLVYLTMEFLNGSPLDQLTRATGFAGLPLDEAVALIRQLGDALAFAHENGVAHCDLKPGNIFLTEKRQVKVIDFGISRPVTTGGDQDVTRFDPAILGAMTPAYASPEVVEGGAPDIASDIFAFGCIAFELLCGRHPFNRIEATKARDSGLSPNFPDFLNSNQVAALAGALEFDPARRIASVRDFLGLFAAAPEVSHGRKKLAVAAAVLAVVLGAGGYFLWQDAGPRVADTAAVSPGTAPSTPPGTGVGIVPSTDLAKILSGPQVAPVPAAQSANGDEAATRESPPMASARPSGAADRVPPVPEETKPERVSQPGGGRVAAPIMQGEPASGRENPAAGRQSGGQSGSAPEAKIAALPRPPALDLPALHRRLSGLDCALLQPAVRAGTLSLVGYAYDRAALSQVEKDVRKLAGVTDVRISARPMSKFQCAVMQFFEPHLRFNRTQGYGLDIRFRQPAGEFRDGDKLIVDLRAPADISYVLVDYFTTDGSVVHIFPEAKGAADKVAANLRVGIGDSGYSMDFPVGPPFGVEMVLAVASRDRIIAPRPDVVEKATEYLKLLFAAVRQRQGQAGAAPVAADIIFGTTMAK